jgi:Tol biopolymer transport system component
MNSDGSGVVQLTNDTAKEGTPVWSPDGQYVAYRSEWSNENWEIFVIRADGTGLLRLTDNDTFDGDPVWAPGGLHLAFQSDRDGNAEIYVVNVDGSGFQRLTFAAPAYDGQPAWSP